VSKSGQTFVAATEGSSFTLYAIVGALGIPLTEEQEKFQIYLEGTYPRVIDKEEKDARLEG